MSSFVLVSLFAIAVALLFAGLHPPALLLSLLHDDTHIDSSFVSLRNLSSSSAFERLWTAPHFFANWSQDVPELSYNASDPQFFLHVEERATPVVVRGGPAMMWPALWKWRSNAYLTTQLRSFKAHAPIKPTVRTHHEQQPWEALPNVSFSRPWKEATISMEALLDGEHLVYSMIDARKLPPSMQRDVDVSRFLQVYRPMVEANVWIGNKVITPAHYDMTGNFYTQIRGRKRFVLFPSSDEFNLYLFTRMHPSARQSQIDFLNESSWTKFPRFRRFATPIEVVLTAGDTLYIPPMYFHYVAALGVSMSLSVHTTSPDVDLRTSIIELSIDAVNKIESASPLWTERLCMVAWHIRGLFFSGNEAVRFVEQVLNASYSHFDLDLESSGIYENVLQARAAFPKDIPSKCAHSAALFDLGAAVAQISRKAPDRDRGRMLISAYVQDTPCEALRGPQYVDPFLRWFIKFAAM
jgi:hypothetical protein